MTWHLSYYNARVEALIERWPAGIRASFLRIVILHAMVKKTEQTPARDLETACARQREVKA